VSLKRLTEHFSGKMLHEITSLDFHGTGFR
jgi:hypothetical protein